MPFAVELYVEPAADRIIRSQWQQIADAGIPSLMITAGHRPHISLAVCEDLDVDRFCSSLETFARSLPPLPIDFSSLGMFTRPEGVLFLAPVVTHLLLDVHAGLNRLVVDYTDHLRPYYCTDRWTPHCTLAYGLTSELLMQAARACLGVELPLKTWIVEIGVSHVTPSNCEGVFTIGVPDCIKER